METKRPRGRPANDTPPAPARILGRVPDEQWARLQAAAAQSGKTFTAWALYYLERAAKKTRK